MSLNGVNQRIRITCEKEENGRVHFPHLTVISRKGRILTKWYKKDD